MTCQHLLYLLINDAGISISKFSFLTIEYSSGNIKNNLFVKNVYMMCCQKNRDLFTIKEDYFLIMLGYHPIVSKLLPVQHSLLGGFSWHVPYRKHSLELALEKSGLSVMQVSFLQWK